jgi:restriction system protein
MLIGGAGTGKSMLAEVFVKKYASEFPGGVIRINQPSLVFENKNQLSGNMGKPNSRTLVVIEEVNSLDASDFDSKIDRILSNPYNQILGISQVRMVSKRIKRTIELSNLNKKEFDELVRKRLLYLSLSESEADDLYKKIGGNPATANAIGNSIRDNLIKLSQVFEYTRPFEKKVILDPDGNPIEPNSKNYRKIITVVHTVNAEFLKKIAKKPSLIYELSPRQFEEIVAELLNRKGYEIKISPATRDGGVDIYAAHKTDLGSFLYVVQCKKYNVEHRVGVGLIRDLLGTVELERATAGIMVTSSFFTKDARELQQKMAYRISLQDYFGIQKWIKEGLNP